MIPTLNGRLQTRIFLLVVVGGIWTVIITPVARLFVDTGAMQSPALTDVYKVTFTVLAVVLVLGVLWELIYHGLMQFRWEKDWPTLFGYVTIVNEGILAYVVVKSLGSTTAPWKNALSLRSNPPTRNNRTLSRKYSAIGSLSASTNTASNPGSSVRSTRRASPSSSRTCPATPASAYAWRASAACRESFSIVVSRPSGGSARASQMPL